MDKFEYKVRAEEIKTLIFEGEFAEAVKLADTIDWQRVKSVMMLCTISDLYKINRRFGESKDILLMAYERHPGGRLIVYSLCELSIKMGEFVQAIEYYKEFVQIAPKDTSRYILQYKLYEAQDVSLEERIAVLEEFKKRDYREKWAYELAYLYHRVGLETKCVEECDEMVLWFGEGRYIVKALELKMLHQPLSYEQEEKYILHKKEKEMGLVLEEPLEEQEQQVTKENAGTQAELEELEYHVKPVDVGQYNTINLQKELAESMKELLYEEPDAPTLGPVVQSIVAPLLEETGEIQSLVIQEEEAVVSIPEPEAAMEEVFFEDVKDVLLEDTRELTVQQSQPEQVGDTKEIKLPKRIIYPAAVPSEIPQHKKIDGEVVKMPMLVKQDQGVKNSVETAATLVMPATPMAPPAMAYPVQMRNIPGAVGQSSFDEMLSQEYDGQITLVVSDSEQLEKQITGQMSITDIMIEWERMKRENEVKRKEDVRRRVQQHTGNLFSEFEEAARDGLLELIEEGAAVPSAPERNDNTVQEIVADVMLNEELEEPIAQEDIGETEALPQIEEAATEEIISVENSDSKMVQPQLVKEMVEDTNRLRPLAEDEKELFGKFINNRKAKEQIINAVDTMSMDSYTDNIVVTGEDAAGTVELAKGLVRMMKLSDSNFNGKVAKISGTILNKKDIAVTLSKLADGAVIIEHAQEISGKTAEELNKALSKENNGLLVIMTGTKEGMNKLLANNHILESNFNARIDIEALDDHALVDYARKYAEDEEYAIDELGILALHTRIADMQTSDHEVTIAEVKELVDDAIYFANKKNPKHFLDILFGKRYDEEDMIILRERDFMHY